MRHFNVSFIVWAVTRQCPYTTIFEGEPKRIEPRSFCLPSLRLTARPHRLTVLSFFVTSLFYRHSSPAAPTLWVQDGRGLCVLSFRPAVWSLLLLHIRNATIIETFLLALRHISSTSINLTSLILDWFAAFFLPLLPVHVAVLMLY